MLGALVIMPSWMGMPVLKIGSMQLQSLVGHLVYGDAFQALVQALAARNVPSRA